MMATLYVTEQGSRIEKEYQRLLVTLEGEVIQSVLLRAVTEVVLVGRCGATTPAILALLDHGVGLSFISQSGKLRGRLRPAENSNLELRLKQYERQHDDRFKLSITRNIALGKIKNYRTMAHRLFRSINKRHEDTSFPGKSLTHNNENLADLQRGLARFPDFLSKITLADDIDSIRGLEGSASKLYFAYLRRGLLWKGERTFLKRQRRPPGDPINVLLSLGYTLLSQCLITAVEVVGLDPLAGYYHTNQYGRPSLALDLMEEFRPIIVDSIVLRMVNQHIIKPNHFSILEDGKIRLNRKGFKIFFQQFHRRINTVVIHKHIGRKLSYQKCFEVQASLMRKVIIGEAGEYRPMPWK